MDKFDKYLVKTEAEINALSALFNGGNTVLPSVGKSLKQIFGGKKTYNQDYFYSVGDLQSRLIDNPEHADFGKYFVPVSSTDVNALAPSESSNMVDYDPSWKQNGQ